MLSAVRVMSSTYLSLLAFFQAILIPACASSSLAFPMMYSEFKLNKQGNNIQPRHTPFPIWNQSVVPCPVLIIAEVDVFLELSCFFEDPRDVGNLISGSSAFSKSNLNIWNFTDLILLRYGLENFEHYFASVWDECNCETVRTFFGIAFLLYWNEHWPFPVLWPLLSFPYLLAFWVQQQHLLGFEIAELEFHHLH